MRRRRRYQKRRIRKEKPKEKKRKTIYKRIKLQKIGHIVTPQHNFDPKIYPKESVKLRWAGPSSGLKESIFFWKTLYAGGQSSIVFSSIFGDRIRISEAAMGEGAQRPVWRGN